MPNLRVVSHRLGGGALGALSRSAGCCGSTLGCWLALLHLSNSFDRRRRIGSMLQDFSLCAVGGRDHCSCHVHIAAVFTGRRRI
ncbi:hypothetical protein EMEDMD4_1280066 [Sinorhizobium medicae]|uniref:Uncharacterized protein n=1 Tax=Sinorhizobium medicae TaxID=110321 RepID=A0A508WW28_9HYPH|nr:hypothetical protein EMEDMD4_1280066 [Sinorhizobium medicae]